MAILGPIPLNGGWVSDADIWNDPGQGRALTYSCFIPWEGGAKTVDNFSAIGAALPNGTQVLGAFYWQDPAQEGNIGTDIYIALSPFKCYTTPTDSISWTDRTNSVSLPGGTYYTFDVLNGKVILANSYQNSLYAPFKISAYNGNIAALGGSPPTCGIVKVVNNFCFLSQNLSGATTISNVYWSNVADPETWGAANFISVNYGDGDIITALSSLGSNLIIFKTNSIWSLSTVTNSVSGSVTLGPLTNLSSNHGCVGQTALDVMPDGTIVFMSSDGHIYRTDGISFTDLSHLPWPNSNIAGPIIGALATPSQFYGPFNFNMVKVDSENHRIFVINSAFSGNQNPIYVYDYFYNGWADWSGMNTGTDNVLYMTTLPYITGTIHNFGAARRRIVMGSFAGFIYMNFPWFSNETQVFDESVDLTCTLEYTIPLIKDGEYFTPLYLVLPYRQPNVPGGNLSVTIGFDGVYQSNAIFSSSISGNGRVNARIPFDITSPSAIRAYSMQVKIQIVSNVSAGVTVLEPFYLSDEVN